MTQALLVPTFDTKGIIHYPEKALGPRYAPETQMTQEMEHKFLLSLVTMPAIELNTLFSFAQSP